MYFEFEWGSIFMLKKSINRLLFSIIIFLCFISHLLQFWTYKQLLYTKLEEMLYGFCRTWPFLAICYRAWAIGSEASPLFYCPPLSAEEFIKGTSVTWLQTNDCSDGVITAWHFLKPLQCIIFCTPSTSLRRWYKSKLKAHLKLLL